MRTFSSAVEGKVNQSLIVLSNHLKQRCAHLFFSNLENKITEHIENDKAAANDYYNN